MESSSSTQKEQEVCQVCRSSLFDTGLFLKLVCKDCSRTVHRFCYAPHFRDKRPFKCDQCRKGIQAKCMICHANNGILKQIDQKNWVHVICGLFSPRVKLISYRTLEMRMVPLQKQNQPEKSCIICNHQSPELFNCWVRECNNFVHPGCIVGSKFFAGNQCYLTYNLLDKHSMMLMTHLQHHQSLYFSFNYLKRKRMRCFVCLDHNDDPNFIFCTCGRSKIKKQKEQVKQINCDRCKRWFHIDCTGVKDLKGDYECTGCRENEFFKKSVMLPEIIQKMMEIESSERLDRKNIKILDSIIFHLSSDIINICTNKRNADEINKYFMQKALEKVAREDRDSDRQKNFDPRIKVSCVLEIIYFLVKREFLVCKHISEKQQRELYETIFFNKINLGLSSETYGMVKDYIKARVRYIERHSERVEKEKEKQKEEYSRERERDKDRLKSRERDRQREKDRDRERDKDRERDRDRERDKNRHHERRGEEREKTLSSSSRHLERETRQFVKQASSSEIIKHQHHSNSHSNSSIFIQLNQVIAKFTNGLLTKGPFTTQILGKEVRDFIKTVQRSEFSRKSFTLLISDSTPILLEVLFKSYLEEEQYRIIFSKYRFVVSLKQKQEITEREIVQLVAWFDEGFQKMHSSKKKQLSTLFQRLIGKYKVVACHEEHESALNKALKKIAAGVSPRETCLIRSNLIKKMMFLAAASQVCVADYTDIYYTIRKKKILKTISSPIRDELIPLIEEIKTNMTNPKFNSSLNSQEKQELEKFMTRSHFFMKIVTHFVKMKGAQDFAKKCNKDEQIPFEDMCVLGGFKNLRETAFEAMMNWNYSAESADFLFNLLAEKPLAGLILSAKEREILTTLTKNVLAVICPIYERHPGVLNPKLLTNICILLDEAGEQSYPLYKKMLQDYQTWKKDIERFSNISEALQNLGDVLEIIDLAAQKMEEAQKIRLDLTSQFRKLRILKVWGQISKKLLTLPETPKFSIITAPNVKTLMDQSQYPNNSIRKKMEKLCQDANFVSRNLKLYSKQKFTDDQLHQQIQKIIKKPWKSEADAFLNQMKKIDLQLYLDICEVQDMIEFHEKIPENLGEWIQEHRNLKDYQLMRKQIIESPFRIKDINSFDFIYRSIYKLKCHEPITSISLQEYNRMLNFGGQSVPMLIEKAIHISNAYTRIEAAKKQILNLKPRLQLLLPLDNREIQSDLKEDQQQLRNLQIMNQNARRLKQKLRLLKEQRADWQKYRELQAEIARQPIALNEVSLEIAALKKRLDECVQQAKVIIMGQANNYCSSECAELIQKYRKTGIRNNEMDRFEILSSRYLAVWKASQRITIKSYPEFNRLCEQYHQISKNLNIRKLRQEAFQEMVQIYLERPGHPAELGQTLLREGGYLIQKISQGSTPDLASKLLKITKRLYGIPLKGELPVVQTPVRDNGDEFKAMTFQQSRHMFGNISTQIIKEEE